MNYNDIEYLSMVLMYRILDRDKLRNICNVKNINCLSHSKPKLILYQKDDTLLVVFRGTSRLNVIHNVAKNSQIFLTDVGNNVKIHTGFNKIFKKIQHKLYSSIKKYKFKKIVFCGSSLGAALSTISCAYYEKPKNVIVYNITCGLPPVGNINFIEKYKQNVSKFVHFVLKNDPVSMLNFRNKKFHRITKYLGYEPMPEYAILKPVLKKLIHHSMIEYLIAYISTYTNYNFSTLNSFIHFYNISNPFI